MLRGEERCDYRPGTWQLEVAVEPLIDGLPAGSFYLAPASLDVPLEPAGTALPFVGMGESRYRGLAATVWREQGEPALLPPRTTSPPPAGIVGGSSTRPRSSFEE